MAANQASADVSLNVDAMIDEIIARKGPHRYTEGLHEDRWEEELEQIPLFTSKQLEEIDPDENPAAAAFQCIKFEEETPEGRAKSHKDEGNALFMKKNYKEAIKEYTEGIKQKSSDATMNAVLLCNRATAHYYLGNYRSSAKDAMRSRELKSDHIKAFIRGATACVEMLSCGEAIEWCDGGLQVEPMNQRLQELRKKAIALKKKQDRDERKSQMEEKKQQKEDDKLITLIKSRGVSLLNDTLTSPNHPCQSRGVSLLNDTLTSPNQPPGGGRVHDNGSGELIWPVTFLYPEHGHCDYIIAFNENSRFVDQLEAMFSDPPGWDSERKYQPSDLEVLYGDADQLTLINSSSTLKEALALLRPTIEGGTPVFVVLSRNSSFRDHYLSQHSFSVLS